MNAHVERYVLITQLYVLFKFILAIFLYYFVIPKLIFPKEIYQKLENRYDEIAFNIIIMTGISTLIFPWFVIIKVFGLLFLITFFLLVKLLFIKLYYKENLSNYILHAYHNIVYTIIRFLEKKPIYLRIIKRNIRKKYISKLKKKLELRFLTKLTITTTVIIFSSFPFIYRGLVCWTEASPDISQFYYWFNLLRKNIIIDRTAGAPYMWGGPMVLHTLNSVINIDPIALVNLAPIFYIGILFIGLYILIYHIHKSIKKNISSNAPLIAILAFSFIMSYKLGTHLLGGSIVTTDPYIADLKIFKLYFKPFYPEFFKDFLYQHFFSFWRMTTYLEEEHAFCFYVISLYLYLRALETKKDIYLNTFSISLGVIASIHVAFGVIIAFTYFPMLLYSFLLEGIDIKFLLTGLKKALIGTTIGLLWMIQFLKFGLPSYFGKALPFLDILLKTNKSQNILLSNPIDIYAVTIFCPSKYVFILFGTAVTFVITGTFFRKNKLKLVGYIGSFIIGVLFIHSFSNFGFPPLSDKTRINNLLVLSYAIEVAIIFLSLEVLILKTTKSQKLLYITSSVTTLGVLLVLISLSHSYAYVYSPEYRKSMTNIEHKEFPVAVYKIRKEFLPFTYTIVSNVQQFAQVVGKGFHINTFKFLLNYKPTDKYLPIPTRYIFLFVEDIPKKFMGLGEFWYRWRIEHNMALKAWIAQYATTHSNIKLWFHNDNVEIYIIDNEDYIKLLERRNIRVRRYDIQNH